MAKTAGGMVGEDPKYDQILYVSKDRLAELGKKLKAKKDELTAKEVEGLVYPEDLDDDKELIPVDISDKGEDFPRAYEEMIEKLGPKGTVQAMVDAAALFEKNKGNFKEEERPIPMTVGEWMVQMTCEDEEDEGGEEEELEGDEEEEPDEEEAEEEKPAEEPAKKKPRKS